tara:strand:+ start:1052 stop:1333 length:282 start_codon:yes stop_codon:yes gene_type:complete
MNNTQLKLPEVTFNKNGYEIRTEILKLAADTVTTEWNSKFQAWEISQRTDKDGTLVTKITAPEFPGLQQIMETAEKMYAFVNFGNKPNTPKSK